MDDRHTQILIWSAAGYRGLASRSDVGGELWYDLKLVPVHINRKRGRHNVMKWGFQFDQAKCKKVSNEYRATRRGRDSGDERIWGRAARPTKRLNNTKHRDSLPSRVFKVNCVCPLCCVLERPPPHIHSQLATPSPCVRLFSFFLLLVAWFRAPLGNPWESSSRPFYHPSPL